MEKNWTVVCSFAFNSAMHRYCLNSQLNSEPTQILKVAFFGFSHSGCETIVKSAEDWLHNTQGSTVKQVGKGMCKKLGVFGKTYQEAFKTLTTSKDRPPDRDRALRIVNNTAQRRLGIELA